MKFRADLLKNICSSFLPQFMNTVTYLVLPTLIISGYGSQTNGLISTVRNIISYISLVGAGIVLATTQALYAPVAKKDVAMVKGMLKATANLFNRCGFIYLGCVFVISTIYPIFVKSDIPYSTMALLLIIMSISGASEFFVVGRCRSLLYANQKVYICSSIQAISILLSLVLAVVMLNLHVDILLVQMAISFVYVSRAFLLYIYVRKEYPEYRYDRDTVPIPKAIEKRNDAMIHQLSGLLVLSSQTIILSLMVDLKAASIYSVYGVVMSGVASICTNLQNALSPYLGRSYASENANSLQKKYNILEFGYYVLVFLLFFTTSKTILSFISIYTRNADVNYVYEKFAMLYVAVQIFNIFRQPCSSMINAAGHFRETRSRALIESGICVVSSVLFTYFYGMYGVLIGLGCAVGWRCIDMIIYVHKRILYTSFFVSFFRLFRIFAYIFCLYYVMPNSFISIDNYASWVVNAIICFGIAIGILLVDVFVFESDFLQRLRK